MKVDFNKLITFQEVWTMIKYTFIVTSVMLILLLNVLWVLDIFDRVPMSSVCVYYWACICCLFIMLALTTMIAKIVIWSDVKEK